LEKTIHTFFNFYAGWTGGECRKMNYPEIFESLLLMGNVEEFAKAAGAASDKFFPIRDKDGPKYRQHQKEAIVDILKAFFIDKKKFVCLDAKVGAGKSPIAYTVCRILGTSSYLTSQKQLQDQIIREGWAKTKMLKGKNAYSCNFATTHYPGKDIRCNYKGDAFKMCNNSEDTYDVSSESDEMIIESIKDVVKRFWNNDRLFRMKTSFEADDDIDQKCRELISFINSDMEIGEVKYPIHRAIGCSMGPFECPIKSRKVMAEMSQIRILNPDVYYLFNQTMFKYSDLMVIDECHTLENCIQRIFDIKFPIRTLYKIFGINLDSLLQARDPKDFIDRYKELYHSHIGPIVCASKIFDDLGGLMNIESYDDLMKYNARNEYVEAFKKGSYDLMTDPQPINMIEIVGMAIKNDIEFISKKYLIPFAELIRHNFVEECKAVECSKDLNIWDSLIPACQNFDDMLKHKSSHNPSRRYGMHIAKIIEVINDQFKLIHKLIDISENKIAFAAGIRKEKIKKICQETDLEYFIDKMNIGGDYDDMLTITPIEIGAILNSFFYQNASKVLLSTGTWIDPEGMLKDFGITDNYKFVNVPSTFNPKARMIFALDNIAYTNFSKKHEGIYDYKTDVGIKKFVYELANTIKDVKQFLFQHHGAGSPNIVIHCHTFEIARMIAEHIPGADKKYLIHISDDSSEIRNNVTGHIFESIHKDALLHYFISHPRSGLIFISPSISEGVDFKYSIARAQIILKRPTPYMKDPYIEIKHKGSEALGIPAVPYYVDRVTCTTMIQQYGRIMRAQDDWGYTFLLDQAIVPLLNRLIYDKELAKKMNVGYFMEAIQFNRFGKLQWIV
jgi:Rad3-related DNA helicase